MFIDTPASEPADPTVAAAYQAATAQFGFLPNWALAFGGRPAVLEAWQRLNVSIRDGMDRRRYELATIAAAQRLSSTYCTLAHSWMLSERLNLIGTDELGSILTDRASAPALSEVDRAVMDFADQVAGTPAGSPKGTWRGCARWGCPTPMCSTSRWPRRPAASSPRCSTPSAPRPIPSWRRRWVRS